MADETARVHQDIAQVEQRIAADNPGHKPPVPTPAGGVSESEQHARKYSDSIKSSQMRDRTAK